MNTSGATSPGVPKNVGVARAGSVVTILCSAMRGVLVRALDAMQSQLPIDPLLPALVDALRDGTRAVLRAAPGAGKTTRVPAALLDAGLAGARQVVVLEPRRIAARAAAEFVARARGGAVGGEVGYRVRFEQRGGPATRLWFVTEGVFCAPARRAIRSSRRSASSCSTSSTSATCRATSRSRSCASCRRPCDPISSWW